MEHRVLFVDDEPLAIAAFVRSMRNSGLQLLTANSAEEALALLERERVEIVVSDEQMPGMPGHELLEKIAKRWPTTVRIMLTGQSDFGVAQRAINRGHVHQFLVKPCETATLLTALNAALQRIELERSSRELLRIARSQKVALDRLEQHHPGITRIARDSDGAMVLDESESASVSDLVRSLDAEIRGPGDAAPGRALTSAAPVLVAAEEWRTIVDALDDLICFVDADGRVIRGNRAIERWGLGDVKNVARQSLHQVLHGECPAQSCELSRWLADACTKQAAGDGTSALVEDPLMKRSLRASCRRLPAPDGAPRGERYLVILNDTTHVRALEHEARRLEVELQQSQKLEAIGRLAAGVAHEINTPTQFVRDNLEFLLSSIDSLAKSSGLHRELIDATLGGTAERSLAEKQQATLRDFDLDYLLAEMPKAASQGIEGISRIATIVRALKAFSHPGGGERTQVDLASCLDSTITVARNEWKYVADVTTDFEPGLPTIEGHPGELNQVFLNLIVNAAQAIGEQPDATTSHAGRIRVTARRDGEAVEIRFADNGPGIPAAIRHRLFEPFFTTKQIGKGTGQGLAFARSIVVRKHGGTIDFESEVGRGTTFILRLPIHAPAGLDAATEAAARTPELPVTPTAAT